MENERTKSDSLGAIAEVTVDIHLLQGKILMG